MIKKSLSASLLPSSPVRDFHLEDSRKDLPRTEPRPPLAAPETPPSTVYARDKSRKSRTGEGAIFTSWLTSAKRSTFYLRPRVMDGLSGLH